MIRLPRLPLPRLPALALPRRAAKARAPAQASRLNHPLLAGTALIATFACAALAIQFLGDPSAAGPRGAVELAPNSAHAESAARVAFSDAAEAGADLGPWAAGGSLDPQLQSDETLLASSEGTAAEGVRISVVGAENVATAPVRPLPRAPIAGLFETTASGRLPIVARDGRSSFQVYSRPFAPTGTPRPRIAIIVGGLGFNQRTTEQAINELPAEVTLSFVPYAANLQSLIDQARARGHEVMLELPMEPFDPGADDTGPQTLLATGPAAQNQARLENLLGRAVGYFGVTNYQGARFATSSEASAPVVQTLRRRGLAFISTGLGQRTALANEAQRIGLSTTAADRIIDSRREAEAIDEQLLNLEALALQNGTAVGAGFAFPVTMVQIAEWSRQLSTRGYDLAPASAVLRSRAGGR